MLFERIIAGINTRSLVLGLAFPIMFNCTISCVDSQPGQTKGSQHGTQNSAAGVKSSDEYQSTNILLVLPKNPVPGEPFRILVTGGGQISRAQIIVEGPPGTLKPIKSTAGEEPPFWMIYNFTGSSAGKYIITLSEDKKVLASRDFVISSREPVPSSGGVWKTLHGWDSNMEIIYSSWINALFHGCDERSSWTALHKVTQDPDRNFLYNYLSLGEDDGNEKINVIMQPDCADNPFFLRAYFAWKLGLPFGFHICDRGYVGRNPKAGQWITNESARSKENPVLAFNSFLRTVMNGVQSGTARTSLDDEKSDYYPVPLERSALRPGTVFADPYGHTLILVSWVPQTKDHPGLLLSVDAQPDGTVGIKRFWKGNFLFNTSEVIGEPGFKAFRPLSYKNGASSPINNPSLKSSSGYIPYSLQQRKMKTDLFYHTMERIINPKPLDPEAALIDLIQALHEQLLVRVTSVANGEAWFKSHPGEVIPMPSSATGIFQTGGQWEDFSTPNRDLRLLIAMDAILDFPDVVARYPEDFDLSQNLSAEKVKEKLQSLMDKKVSDLSITYNRSDGSLQKLTLGELLKRRDAFEMGYNPNDGIEIRWGAPEKSEELSSCRRHSSARQNETMRSARTWFHKRLHPPT